MDTTFNSIASQIALLEDGKSNVKIGDVREILSKLSVLMATDPEVISVLIQNGLQNIKDNNAVDTGK